MITVIAVFATLVVVLASLAWCAISIAKDEDVAHLMRMKREADSKAWTQNQEKH